MATHLDLTPERVLHELEWTVLRPLDGRLQGDYHTLFRGSGVDLRDLREYVPGDDPRRIDWNVTARMDTPYVREYAEDRELTAWLLLDRSASMEFGPAHRTKDVVLLELSALFARLLTRGGNRVGALLYDTSVDVTLPPRQGRAQALRVIRELQRRRSRAAAKTELGGLLRSALGIIRQRSLVVVVSDFVSAPGWERPLRQLAQRHDLLAVQITDPLERELPDVGVIVVEDAETGEQVRVDTSDGEVRSRLRALADDDRRRVMEVMRDGGIDVHTVSTDEDLVGAFLRISTVRKLRRR